MERKTYADLYDTIGLRSMSLTWTQKLSVISLI